jgi:H/ACA ribonucleoprotein complex subunit 4
VTGVLPVALGESTKILQAILAGGKEYICIMKLHGDLPKERLNELLNEFTGEIYQRPPLRSSVKRQIRKRIIYYNRLLEFEGRNVLFRVGCQSGTYIRKLVHDIGEAAGCGAHMVELRRTRAGPFVDDQSLITLHKLSDAYSDWREKGDETSLVKLIQPMEKATLLMPKIYVRDSAVDAICHGANLAVPGVVKLSSGIRTSDLVAIFTLKEEIIALAKASMPTETIIESEHGIAAKTERVIMKPGTYPKTW